MSSSKRTFHYQLIFRPISTNARSNFFSFFFLTVMHFKIKCSLLKVTWMSSEMHCHLRQRLILKLPPINFFVMSDFLYNIIDQVLVLLKRSKEPLTFVQTYILHFLFEKKEFNLVRNWLYIDWKDFRYGKSLLFV